MEVKGAIALAFIYFAIVYLAAFVVKKLKLIQKPIVKKGFFLFVMKNSGIFIFLALPQNLWVDFLRHDSGVR